MITPSYILILVMRVDVFEHRNGSCSNHFFFLLNVTEVQWCSDVHESRYDGLKSVQDSRAASSLRNDSEYDNLKCRKDAGLGLEMTSFAYIRCICIHKTFQKILLFVLMFEFLFIVSSSLVSDSAFTQLFTLKDVFETKVSFDYV